ncbi:MAG: hypothetical protein M2R45_01498 [Verrucomicrobia subdivision 3 bacterium]|nr:hypothetical protein [Limisphaerales bacterium]MCS1413372.1 hypothetical protein [Limisphaerales bacterium]
MRGIAEGQLMTPRALAGDEHVKCIGILNSPIGFDHMVVLGVIGKVDRWSIGLWIKEDEIG